MLTQAPSNPLRTAPANPARRLQGIWLWSARTLWIALFLLMLVLNGAAFAAHLDNNAVGSGVAGLEVESNQQQEYRLRVDPQGAAAHAGIQEGDRLLAINGAPVQPGASHQAINRQLHGDIGSTLTLTVQGADATIHEHTVTLAAEHQVWRRFRLPLGRAGIYFPLLEAILLAGYLLTAVLIFWRRSDDWMALYLSATLMLITPQLSYSWYYLIESYPPPEALLGLLISVAVAITLPNFYLLPDGRFVPRGSMALALIWVVWCVAMELFPTAPFSIYTWSGATQLLVWLGWYATGMLAQVYRYRYVANPEERQQIKWVGFGLTIAVLVNLGWTLAFEIFPVLNQPGNPNLVMWLVGRTVYVLGMLLLPISFGIAVFRYRLWDIDNLINRTLVYGALTGIIIGIYVVVVTFVEVFFEADGSMIALALDLVLLDPLRERLQKGADHLMFGESDDLPTVISRLGERLRTAPDAEAVLPTIVETLAEALKIPYAAIALQEGEALRVAASYGESVIATYSWPLVYHNQAVGQLILAPRATGEHFKPTDWQLVENIAHQASIAAHDILLEGELKQRQSAPRLDPA